LWDIFFKKIDLNPDGLGTSNPIAVLNQNWSAASIQNYLNGKKISSLILFSAKEDYYFMRASEKHLPTDIFANVSLRLILMY
jgi:hypothetical protein